MKEERIITGVDALIDFLEKKEKATLKEISQAINVPETTIQLWVDFLVEEQILGVEYKFTTAYIFLNKKQKDKEDLDEIDEVRIEQFKEEFFKKAKTDKIPIEKIPSLWENHLLDAIEKEKDFFHKEAINRDLHNSSTLFKLYKKSYFHYNNN
jgi:predicted transcriptional regulator